MTAFEIREREKCQKKSRHCSRLIAESHADHVGKKYKKAGEPRAYKCPWCDGWHITRNKAHQ